MHNIPDFLRITPEMQEHFANGGMIKRADGSYSRRGLWDNIRANKGSGRKPTKEMLEQEAKIKAAYGGLMRFEEGGAGNTNQPVTQIKQIFGTTQAIPGQQASYNATITPGNQNTGNTVNALNTSATVGNNNYSVTGSANVANDRLADYGVNANVNKGNFSGGASYNTTTQPGSPDTYTANAAYNSPSGLNINGSLNGTTVTGVNDVNLGASYNKNNVQAQAQYTRNLNIPGAYNYTGSVGYGTPKMNITGNVSGNNNAPVSSYGVTAGYSPAPGVTATANYTHNVGSSPEQPANSVNVGMRYNVPSSTPRQQPKTFTNAAPAPDPFLSLTQQQKFGGFMKFVNGGEVDEYGKGGYTVRRSNDRKGKTHVVIGPDGTKKYFGDAKLGQHPRDPERKKAFYARHKHNLDNNPYFRAFARATWETGGEVPEYQDGTSAVDLTEVRISPRQYKELSNEELRALHNKVGRPESSDKKDRLPKIIRDSIRNDVRSIKRLKNAITNSAGTTNVILGPSTQYEGNNGQYYALTPREAEQFNQYESNLPWYKNLWYNVATRDIPQGSRLANYEQRQGAYMNNFPYVYTDTNGEATQLNAPVVYKGKTYTTPFIVNPEEEGSVYYSDGTVAPSYRPNTNNSTQVNPAWIAQMQQQGYKTGGYYSGFFSQTEANRIKRSRTPNPDSMTPSFFPGGFTEEKDNPFENMDLFGSQSQGYPGASSIQNSNLNSANKINTKMTPLQEKWAHEEMGKNLEKTQSSPFAKEARVFKDKLRDPNSDLNKTLSKTNLNDPYGFNNNYQPFGTKGDIGLGLSTALAIGSRVNEKSAYNAVLKNLVKENNPLNYINTAVTPGAVDYYAKGGNVGQYKEGEELDLTPTQMYLLEKKGYKFQILNK